MSGCLVASSYTNPTIEDFKDYFIRDFPYGTTPDTVMDADITKALNMAGINFNPGLFGSQTAYTTGYLLLSAHYLVMNLRSSSQGIAGTYAWMETSKSVGSVSQGLGIPDNIMANPQFAMLTKTNYGAEFLFLIWPAIRGQMFIAYGSTRP